MRFQYIQREESTNRNDLSGSGPSIVITQVANFGSPGGGTIAPLEKVTQALENITWTNGEHVIKIGGGFSFIDGFRRTAVYSRYTFDSVDAYLLARTGVDTRSYQFYDETFGDPDSRYRSTFGTCLLRTIGRSRPD
jgi:hypothetical protein